MAIPQYQNYTKKAAYSEIIMAMTPIKTAIDVCFATEGELTECDTAAKIGENLPSGLTNKALNKIEIAATTAKITATPNAYKGILATETCELTPTEVSGRLEWNYGGQCKSAGYAK